MIAVEIGRVRWTVAAGLFFILFLQLCAFPSIDDAPLSEIECGADTEYPGFQSWEDRQPFMMIMGGPADTPNFGLYGSNIGDVNGDGCDDFVSMDFNSTSGHPFSECNDTIMLPGRSDGAFNDGQYGKLGVGLLTYACGDVNGDGYADVISVFRPIPWLWTDLPRDFVFEVRFGGDHGIKETVDQSFTVEPITKDLEGFYRGPPSSIYPIGDVNGDGFDDLLTFGLGRTSNLEFTAEFQIFHGSIDGLETEPGATYALSLEEPKDYEMWNWTRQILSADVNGDGFSDVIIAHGEPYYWGQYDKPDYITIHLGSSDGFSPTPDLRIEQPDSDYMPYLMAPVNLNGDRYEDVAIVETPASEGSKGDGVQICFLAGSKDGLSGNRISGRSLPTEEGGNGPHLGFSDLDGNGLDDLLIINNRIVNASGSPEFPDYYNRQLILWRNENGTFNGNPWWSQTITLSTGDHVKIHRGDYDGDGMGDFLITISGWEYVTTDYPTPSRDGKVILLLGGRSDHIGSPVFLKGGPLLYANYSDYDFIIEERPYHGLDLSGITIRLDPQVADHRIHLSQSDGTEPDDGWVAEVVTDDPVITATDLCRFRDSRDNTTWFNISIMFGWDWPNEDPCDIEIEYTYGAGPGQSKSQSVTVPDVFSVENDLDLVGDLEVVGEYQGILEPGDWVRGGEEVTVSGLRVVYQGTTDVFPPADVCEVVVYDEEEDNTHVPNPSGDGVVLSLTLGTVSRPNDHLSVKLQALPGLARGPAPITFAIRIDADHPTFSNLIPDGDEWMSSRPVTVAATADDTGTSGVDAGTLEYSLRGPDVYAGWTRTGVETTPDGPIVDGLVRLDLPDGDGYYLLWRVRDLVGNTHVLPTEVRLRIDTRNVTFTDAVPPADVWHNVSLLLAGVTITDTEGSGIDVDTIMYRLSPGNLSMYGEWTRYTGQHTSSRVVEPRVYLDLGEGPYNYVQWRAADIAGNGLTVSDHFRVRVDTTPPSFRDFEPTGFQNSTEVTVSVVVDDGSLGIGVYQVPDPLTLVLPPRLHYRVSAGGAPYGEWMQAAAVPVGASSGAARACILRATLTGLAEGPDNLVQFRAYDLLGNGPALSEEYVVMVDTQGPSMFNITPLPEDVQPHPEVAVGLSLEDLLSGVAIDRVQYRYGSQGPDSLGEWMRMPVSPVDGHYEGAVTIRMDPGRTNYVEFRAFDLLGNVNSTGPRVVWVNRAPTAVITSPANGTAFDEGTVIDLDARDSWDPDGDLLEREWVLERGGVRVEFEGDAVGNLRPGLYDLTLVVRDPQGATGVATVHFSVVKAEEGLLQGMSGLLLVLIVAVVVVLVALYLRLRRGPVTEDQVK